MKKRKLVIGLEIELEYDPYVIGEIEIGDYHGGGGCKYGDDFCAEYDSSIEPETWDDSGSAELISRPFKQEDLQKVLNSFKRETYRRVARNKKITIAEAKKKYLLNHIFDFNSSTGAHIHFSIEGKTKDETTTVIRCRNHGYVMKTKRVDITDLITAKQLLQIGRKIKEDIKKEMPNFSNAFERGYIRPHVGKIEEKQILKGRDKHTEWSIREELGTIEYRAFNLHTISTWEDMQKAYKIVIKRISNEIEKYIAKNQLLLKEDISTTYRVTNNLNNKREIEVKLNKLNSKGTRRITLEKEKKYKGEIYV